MRKTPERGVRAAPLLAAAALAAAVAAGCAGIPIPDDKSEYVGKWEGDGMSLTITSGGSIAYERVGDRGKTEVNGPIKAFDGDDFVVGLFAFTTTFVVSETPHEMDGEWHMTVDGVDLVRVR